MLVTIHRQGMDIFLGGTCNESKWRDKFISILESKYPDITYYNPVVEDWNYEAQANEEYQKKNCIVELYCITPKMTGIYSIAELIDASNKKPVRTIGVLLFEDDGVTFEEHTRRSVCKTFDLACNCNNAIYCKDLEEAADIASEIVNGYKHKRRFIIPSIITYGDKNE